MIPEVLDYRLAVELLHRKHMVYHDIGQDRHKYVQKGHKMEQPNGRIHDIEQQQALDDFCTVGGGPESS